MGSALDGFFQRPYLLWFVAEDPVRNGRLPGNIAEVAGTIIRAAQRSEVASLQEQLDYALRLVAWSWIARECGVQIALIDVLMDAGATPGETNNALVNHNVAAAEHLVARGAPLTLATALCLEPLGRRHAARAHRRSRPEELRLRARRAPRPGRCAPPDARARRRRQRAEPDLYSHGTPLHHAVCSGSLESVRVLVEAGAGLGTSDTAWNGTPLGWAEYYLAGSGGARGGKQDAEIAAYLRERGAATD